MQPYTFSYEVRVTILLSTHLAKIDTTRKNPPLLPVFLVVGSLAPYFSISGEHDS